MDLLTATSLCALFVAQLQHSQECAPPAQKNSVAIDHWHDLVAAAAGRFQIPANWIDAVIRLESAGHTTMNGRPITSSAGAMGLMQLMPATYAEMRAEYGLGADPFDPHDNIFAGSAYLHEMYLRYGYPDLFAAYNSGPGRLDAYLAGIKPLPAATKIYLASIIPALETVSARSPNPGADSLFFVRLGDGNSSLDAAKPVRSASSLFVPLHTDMR